MTSATTIRGAVVPAAGRGTRLAPLTLGIPKELLPLGAYPAIVATLLEAEAAGLHELVFVVSAEKEGLRRFLDRFEPAQRFAIAIVEQPAPVGVLDAVARGLAHFGPTEPVAVLFPDLVHLPDQTALVQLLQVHRATGGAVFGLRTTTERSTPTAAIELAAETTLVGGAALPIARVRPPTAGPGASTTFGQIHTAALGEAIERHCRRGPGAPLDDAGLVAALDGLAQTGGLSGVLLEGEVVDLGTMPGYLDAARRFLGGAARLRGLR